MSSMKFSFLHSHEKRFYTIFQATINIFYNHDESYIMIIKVCFRIFAIYFFKYNFNLGFNHGLS